MAPDGEITMRTSVLFNILPGVIQCRLPKLPSLRSSITWYGLETLRQRSPSMLSLSQPNSGTTTPRDEYSDAMSVQSFDQDDVRGLVVRRRMSLDMSSVTCVEEHKSRADGTGINWKIASQGHDLLRIAATESSDTHERLETTGFTRQLYIHGLTYLLRALPTNLTMEERMSIHAALPADILEEGHVQRPPPPAQRSILHRTLASTIIQIFVIGQCLLPYIIFLLSAAYQYDREHKVVQRAMEQGMAAMDKIGKSSLAVGAMAVELGDGTVGQVVGQATKWVLDGVAGGVQEGVGEIMTMVAPHGSRSMPTSL